MDSAGFVWGLIVGCRERWNKTSDTMRGLDRPLELQKLEAPRISRLSAPECGKVVSPTQQPPLPSRRYPWYHRCRGEFRPRQTRQLPRAVDLKGRLLSCQSY